MKFGIRSTGNGMLVMKFGGTSVKDAAAIARVVAIVGDARAAAEAGTVAESAAGAPVASKAPLGPLVVVSALSKVTDGLLTLSACAESGAPDGALKLIEDLRQRHHETARGCVRDQGRLAAVGAYIDDELAGLRSLVQALAVVREATPRLRDAAVSVGEQLSSRIVAAAIEEAALPAEWVDAREVLVTDDRAPASPLMDETCARCAMTLAPLLASGRVPVLGGFIGATARGVTTTLGRGGSDYSASIFGVGVGAAEIQIWTDVDGMLTADPRVIQGTRSLPQITFDEASELAYFGAKVLHPSTIFPAVSAKIPVRILNSMRPQSPGTLIAAAAPPGPVPLTAIACKRDVTVIDIVSSRMLMAHGFLKRLFEVFERHQTAVDVVTTSEVSVSVTIDDRRQLQAIVRDLSAFAEVTTTDRMALVCAVGERLRTQPGLSARVIGTLDDLPLRMVSQAGSRRNLTFVLPEEHLAAAMTRLHERFCVGQPEPVSTRA